MRTRYQQENDALLESMVQRTFLDSFSRGRKERPYNDLELIITPDCELSCRYCYMSRHGERLYHPSIRNPETILENLALVLQWLLENGYTPTLDIFSGSPLSQPIGLDVLNLIARTYRGVPDRAKPTSVIIPANFTFLFEKDMTERARAAVAELREAGIPTLVSASVDGKFMDMNRPIRKGSNCPGKHWEYDDPFYDRFFEFAKEVGAGFHPMVYSHGIERWKDNFLWFQDHFARHGVRWWDIYLLEVRNEEWNAKQIASYCDFIRFLILWSWERCGQDPRSFLDFLLRRRGFNILASTLLPFTSRGTTCGIQNSLAVRLGDLAIVPCHRTMYSGYEYGRFRVTENRITGLEAHNVELATAIFSMSFRNQPFCQGCLLAPICTGGCLGAQFEATGDMFTPIPTVCRLFHRKTYTILSVLREIGVLDELKATMGTTISDLYDQILQVGGVEK